MDSSINTQKENELKHFFFKKRQFLPPCKCSLEENNAGTQCEDLICMSNFPNIYFYDLGKVTYSFWVLLSV